MATESAKEAIKNANIDANDLDLIIVATLTPDNFMPSTACSVQKEIGAINALCLIYLQLVQDLYTDLR